MSGVTYPDITVVDENDENPRPARLIDALEHGWIRRGARVFVVNKHSQILLQERSADVFMPGLLDTSVGGHVDWGESYIDTAKREMAEELGLMVSTELLEPLPLTTEKQFFSRNYLHRTTHMEFSFDAREVAAIRWYALQEINQLVVETPELCTISLLEIWPQLSEVIHQKLNAES